MVKQDDVAASDLVPLGEGALALGLTREQALRRLQRQKISGVFQDGRWYFKREALSRALAELPAKVD